MGSVQSPIECPDCGYEEAIEDFYYKTGEVYICCSRCGYYYQQTIKRDKNGKPITKDGEFQWEKVEKHGAGIYESHREGSIGYAVGSLLQDKNKRDKQIAELRKTESEIDNLTIKIKPYTKHIKG